MRYQTDHRNEQRFGAAEEPGGAERPPAEDVLGTDDRAAGPAVAPGAVPEEHDRQAAHREEAPAEGPPTEEPPATGPEEAMPEVAAAGSLAAMWSPDTAQGFRERWREIQLRFVDDPRGAASEAQELLAEVLEAFSETLLTRKAELDAWGGTEGVDTEQLRVATRRYRDLLNQLLGL